MNRLLALHDLCGLLNVFGQAGPSRRDFVRPLRFDWLKFDSVNSEATPTLR
jgi:hypothetical protein